MQWSPLTPEEWAALQKATDKPIKVTFNLHEVDGYLPPADEEQFVWAVKSTEADFKEKRPELFTGAEKLPYDVGTLGFVIFSPICPHLGCRYSWVDGQSKFICPCHGSEFTNDGAHIAGPRAARSRPVAAPRLGRQSRADVDRIQAEHPRSHRPAHRLIGER